MKKAKFEIFYDSAGYFRVRLRAINGKILLATEGFTTKQSAHYAIGAIRKCASAPVVDLTK